MVLYSASEMSNIFEIDKSSFTRWKSDGLTYHRKDGNKKEVFYNPMEFIEWHATNISSSKFRFYSSEDEEYSVEDQLRLKRMEKLELEMSIQRGEYISIDEVDETTSGLIALLINMLRQLMRILPKKLAKKTEVQIKKTLDSEFEKMIVKIRSRLEEE